MSEYKILKPKNEITISGLYSLHYFQFASGYVFNGEKHDFWELAYIDQGEAEIGAGQDVFQLYPGQLIFHKPNEFHTIWANFAKGTNIFVVSFRCASPAMREFQGKQYTLLSAQRLLLSRIIAEGQRAFGPVLDISDQKQLFLIPTAPRGGVQMIILYLTQLLLDLLRTRQPSSAGPIRPRVTEEEDFSVYFDRARDLMASRLDGTLRFAQVCREAGLSATVFKERFRRYAGITVMDYYRRLRIDEARRQLRSGLKNIAQVADELGYSSAGAFSRQFKRVMKLTPSEYCSSVRQ
ncbi:MAG TPA: AraC family transcriptional regulator [Candidatus Limiplasma sp.]|nr:AraC family transcriptional regulator [Candidatus Limiplasma sp.]